MGVVFTQLSFFLSVELKHAELRLSEVKSNNKQQGVFTFS